ncbi:MAG: hypothetical protein JWN72_190 [Thermoleophilia bacterium]|nr:hypothetical protein [Thermoleophilia bacterium]
MGVGTPQLRPAGGAVNGYGRTHVKLRFGFALLLVGALIAAGCGSDSKDSKDKGSTKTTATTKSTSTATDTEDKDKALASAKKAFAKKSGDIDLCRDLAMKYISVASPTSSTDPKVAPKQPKGREKNLKSAVKTLKTCQQIDTKNVDVKQMISSAYMALNQYDDAAPLLEEIAKGSKGDSAPNAYYAWGLAAGNAQNYDDAIAAWTKFVTLSDPKDTRVAQVQQSIKALKLAKKQAATPAKTPVAATDSS